MPGLDNATAKFVIQIVQEGSTATAVQDFKNLQAVTQGAFDQNQRANDIIARGLAAVSAGTKTATAGAEEATGSITRLAGASYYARSAIDSIRYAAAGGGARAGFYAIDEAVRGLIQSGIGLGTIVPVIGAVAAAAGAAYLVWREFGEGEREVAERAKDIQTAMKDLLPVLEQVKNLQGAGLLSTAAAGKYSDELLHPGNYYVDEKGQITTQATHRGTPDLQRPWEDTAVNMQRPWEQPQADLPNQRATEADVAKWVTAQITADGTVTDEQIKSRQQVSEMEQKAHELTLSNIEQEKAKYVDEAQARITALTDAFQKESAQFGGVNLVGPAETQKYNQAVADIKTREQSDVQGVSDKASAAVDKSYLDYLKEEDAVYNKLAADEKRLAAEKDAASKELVRLNNEVTDSTLTGEARKQAVIKQTTDAWVAQFDKLAAELGLSQQEMDAWHKKAQQAAQTASQNSQDSANGDNIDIVKAAKQQFASGFSSAFVDFVDGSKKAKQAFEEFAASFLQNLAKMILEKELLSALGALFPAAGGGVFTAAAAGGIFPEAAATGGVFEAHHHARRLHHLTFPHRLAAGGTAGMVDSPTYFPRFNVLAGEAGAEMMAVLARPTFRNLGGIDAVVGNAGPNRLALAPASSLENRGGSVSRIDLNVNMHPDLQYKIINQSIQGARVQVSEDLARNTPIAKGVKALTA